jgi:hypothetical protein
MVFIRNVFGPNHVQNKILQKSLLLLIFRPYNFASFVTVLIKLFCGLGVIELFIVFHQIIVVSNFSQKSLPTKNFGSKSKANSSASSPGQDTFTIQSQGAAKKKLPSGKHLFIFLRKS